MLILASSSPIRQKILTRLGFTFDIFPANIDEFIGKQECPEQAVCRLAKEKALAIKQQGIIISSDQIALLDGQYLSKPLNHHNAVLQLQQCSNKEVVFLSSVCVYNTTNKTIQVDCVKTWVKFLELSNNTIENYLKKDKPYQCVGSFKAESLGVVLFEKIKSTDPDALLGMPSITLLKMLKKEGISAV